jgi:hypothetical protein
MHATVLSIWICFLVCGDLNVRSFEPTFVLKIVALKIFNSSSVMVPIVNKSSYVAKNISSSSYVMPSIKS